MTVPYMPKWIEGEPDELKTGMLAIYDDGSSYLISSIDDGSTFCDGIIRYTQLIQPHELEWITEKGLTLR